MNARVGARFLDDLEVSLDLGWVDQTEDVVQRNTRRRNALVALVTRLRPELIFTGTWSAERQTTESPQLSDARTNLDLRSRLSYRPTPVFGGAVELLYQDLATGEGFAHLYDVDWLPFPGGALQIQISLVQDRRSITGERRDESRLGARWTLNPRLLLETSFTRITSGAEDAQASNLATVFLEWRF